MPYLNSDNLVILCGNIVRDAAVKFTNSQKQVISFTLAVKKYSKDGQNNAEFFEVSAWEKTAEYLDHVTKGERCRVIGEIGGINAYTTKAGESRSVIKIVANRVDILAKRAKSGAATSEDAPDSPDGDAPF